ncbi:Pex29p [Saccharomyces cerevisiae YJM1419]|uniref:Peroxin n=1 Tax=Saccharomyces cerevisiae (strain YJM789) TaxID=307796 RepID=A6ZZ68_YEAS7|nr:Pex29p [Saccharomyces cerevisiae YJM320]AJU68778.1 Pex29p [Saccharomyces cerevisiae YJM541]AJU69470.1 Pex29p [Saccharomyces cerevisiae YJM554]AJU70185.1 Pex29p [Saccharomyces cerevisiae YJM555]AJV04465.1 Pex29p [Saccharomyces cerevisiae YJM1401]AJV07987.1 Pex29p [Saccharomyces cerevisiae YJM1419]AJV11444.1 Pex29p [Saccharomyces cerevisiae YJM1444]EDN60798.1 peroxin [Saccharomyces cerevisiae YJM789]CAI4376272.1 CCN_G0013060.mRNA.1.CDS.1 [Saccharomyces cerevisiae]
MDSVTNFFWNDTYNAGTPTRSTLKGKKVQNGIDGKSQAKKESISSGSRTSDPTRGSLSSSSGQPTSGGGFPSTSNIQKMMADTLVEKIIKMALPPSSKTAVDTIHHRMVAGKERPKLSVQITSRNFIQMNSRLGVPFMIMDELIKILNWTNPAYTVSIMFLYTLIILKPFQMLSSLPIFYLLFCVMVPQYLYIHKPNPTSYLDNNQTPAQGPPLRRPEVPKPVPELSQEFVLNLTDLQNHMLLYVKFYDFTLLILQKFAFFTNEAISSFYFIVLLIIATLNFLYMDKFIKLIPMRPVLILLGWGFFIASHPSNREYLLTKLNSEETRLKTLTISTNLESKILQHLKLIEAREHRLVMIFEIQKYLPEYKEWRPVGFSDDDYSLFSSLRIYQRRIEENSVKSLEEIEPPKDWEWEANSHWVLDLDPKEWVEDEFIQYVEIDSETKWVYDLNLDGQRGSYRRRMWTNSCVRKKLDSGISSNLGEEEVVNPLREETYRQGVHGVTKGSMSGGLTHSSDDDRADEESINGTIPNLNNIDADASYPSIEELTDTLNSTI